MPPHSSHLLQPLDVGCFSPLKRAYGGQISVLVRHHINHISKLEFLPAFKAAFEKTFSSINIISSFRGAGLIPFEPGVVLSKLDVRLRTPTPPTPPPANTASWESRTPSNVQEMNFQSTLVRRRFQRHQNSSPTELLSELAKLTKGAEMMMHSAVLLRDQVVSLQKANEEVSKRKSRKRKYIKDQPTLTMAEGLEFVPGGVARRKIVDGEVLSQKHPAKQRRCGKCNKPGHNSRTCQDGAKMSSRSDRDSQKSTN